MSKVYFDVDAYTARLIGRENVSRLEGAVSELVKNTYDADANCCILYYENSTQTLYLADNGCGMTSDIIKKHWMTIGNSSKKKTYLSKKGRIQTGAKGIGRFALDRIGDRCTMYTKSSTETLEWSVDWSNFRDGTPLTSVEANLEPVSYTAAEFVVDAVNLDFQRFIQEKCQENCTIFRICPVRDHWNEKQIKKMRGNLSTLIPQEISEIFNIYFFEEFTKTEDARLIPEVSDSSCDYKLSFEVVGDKVHVAISRNEFDFKSKREIIIEEADFTAEDKEYFCGRDIIYELSFRTFMSSRKVVIENTIGDFSGVFLFSKRLQQGAEKEKYFYKSGNQAELPWKGVRIYRDNFRVRPYGDPDSSAYDWLLLSNRKAKSPAAPSHTDGKWRVAADQICGTVLISRTNITLPDQANREGFVETPEFSVLKNFLLAVIQLFESDRQYVFKKLNAYYEKTHPTQQFETEITQKAAFVEAQKKQDGNTLSQNAALGVQTTVEASKAQAVIDQRDAQIRSLENENQLLRALATIGIITNTYVHEIRGSTNTLGLKIVMAKEELEYDKNIEGALKYIDEAITCQQSFGSWFKVTIESVKKDRRTMKDVNLPQLLENLKASWEDTCPDTEISVECDPITFRCFPYEIESIVNNLVANSTSAFKSVNQVERKIHIKVCQRDNFIDIFYQDNGPGLSTKYKKNPDLIMDAMETDKMDADGEIIGTGMGMWIIGKTVRDYKGTIDLSENIDAEVGFHVTISLKGRR